MEVATESSQPLIRRVYRMADRWSPLGAVFFIAIAFRTLVEVSAEYDWRVGLIVLVPAAGIVLAMIQGLRHKQYEKFETPVVLALFLLASLLALAVFASASSLLQARAPGTYTSTVEITPGRLADFYAYAMIDSVPGVRIWDTFQVEPPVAYRGFAPALLLLLFRILVVMQLAVAFKGWIARGERDAQQPPAGTR